MDNNNGIRLALEVIANRLFAIWILFFFLGGTALLVWGTTIREAKDAARTETCECAPAKGED